MNESSHFASLPFDFGSLQMANPLMGYKKFMRCSLFFAGLPLDDDDDDDSRTYFIVCLQILEILNSFHIRKKNI